MTQNALAKFDQAKRALAVARSFDEVKLVRDQAEALRLYVRQQGESLEMQNDMAEIKLRAERRAGALLAARDKNKGAQGVGVSFHDESAPTLDELGISHSQSHRWQTETQVPDEMFEQYMAKTRANNGDLTSKDLYRLGQRLKQAEEREQTQANVLELPEIGDLNRAIVLDPPWPMQKILRDAAPNQDIFDYRTMTVDEIAKLPIADLADPAGCHVYLWVTQKYVPVGFDLFRAWGVAYECLLTWHKNVGFTPFSWMYDTEHVLFGRIGTLPLQEMGLRLGFNAKANGHSVKPDEFYDRVIRASPTPRLELFARRPRDGFRVWGDEI